MQKPLVLLVILIMGSTSAVAQERWIAGWTWAPSANLGPTGAPSRPNPNDVRGDLVRIIDGLMRRKGKFDAIIVETTGLADPAPVAQTFFMDENVGAKTRLDAVVT
eukprot:gene12702-16928_t